MLLLKNRAIALLLFAAFTAGLTKADVVFSNLVPSDTDFRFVCGGSAVDADQCPMDPPYATLWAGQFTPEANYTLTNAQVAVGSVYGSDPAFNVFLYANSIDPYSRAHVPGSVIEQIGFALSSGGDGLPVPLVTAGSISKPVTLSSGTIYWLVVAPATPTSVVAWQQGDVWFDPVGFYPTGAFSEFGGSSWETYVFEDLPATASQFVINGVPQTAVPEPSGRLMMAAACTVFFLNRYRCRSKLPS